MKSVESFGNKTREDFAHHWREVLVLLAVLIAAPAIPAPDDGPRIIINDQPLALSQPVINRGGVLLLPMRDVFQALGLQLVWHGPERKIEARRGETLIELWVMTPVAQVNSNPVQLRTPPVMVGEVTYVPLRLPAEALGARVRWDPSSHTAHVTTAP